MSLEFLGKHADFLADETPEIDLEGALSCGKTTVALCKELRACKDEPGIWALIGRWTEEAVKSKLRPAIEQMMRILASLPADHPLAWPGLVWDWESGENYYSLPNGSRIFSFGLRTQETDPNKRYSKIRGLPVSRICIDQAEELPSDFPGELRARLRPDLEAVLRGQRFRRQLTFIPNPANDDSWLSKQFPAANTIKGRRYYALSLFDNAHNLPAEMIDSMLLAYPPEHPKHQTVILGQRGLNVIGDPIYEQAFSRAIHVREAPPAVQPQYLIEAFEVGQHNPTWVIASRSYAGGLTFLGGVMAKHQLLDVFLPVVKQCRLDWFGKDAAIKTCTGPMGKATKTRTGMRYTLHTMLLAANLRPIWRENANAPDVQLASIEEVGAMLRRRIRATEEAISINSDLARWIVILPDGTQKTVPFLSFAFEGGYVWSPHMVSVSDKDVRQPHNDDEYFNAMRCVEHLVLNFCAGQKSDAEKDDARRKITAAHRPAVVPAGGPHSWMGQ